MKEQIKQLREKVLYNGSEVKTARWQGTDEPPVFLESLHVSQMFDMFPDVASASAGCGAKQPWADTHFAERTCGQPLNPPPSHTMWARSTADYFEGGKQFSHSYPERMWSKGLHSGIRYDIADLNTLAEVFAKEPDTRQGYLPLFFPEDLSASLVGDRVPCTLGWHFIVRNGKMDCFYPMRSCDVMRHLHNDLYFANRLALWLIEKAGLVNVVPGKLHFVATSLHCFKQDKELYEKGVIK